MAVCQYVGNLQGLRREGIGTLNARKGVGWQLSSTTVPFLFFVRGFTRTACS